jgi:hypothetical protein
MNPIFHVIEGFVAAIAIANVLAVALNTFNKNVIVSLQAGQISYIIPLIIGLSWFAVFSKKTIPIFRVLSLMTLASTLGIELCLNFIRLWDSMGKWVIISSFESGLFVIGVLTIIVYFTFSKYLEGPLKPIRNVGRFFLLCNFGSSVAIRWFRGGINGFIYNTQVIWTGPPMGLILPAVIGLVLVLDATGVWKRVFTRQATVEVA